MAYRRISDASPHGYDKVARNYFPTLCRAATWTPALLFGSIFIRRNDPGKTRGAFEDLAWGGSTLGAPLAADQRRRDAAERIAARGTGGWPGLVASACPR